MLLDKLAQKAGIPAEYYKLCKETKDVAIVAEKVSAELKADDSLNKEIWDDKLIRNLSDFISKFYMESSSTKNTA